MRKLILGIIAVVCLQIAFVALIRRDALDGLSSSAIDVASVSPGDESRLSEDPTESSPDVPLAAEPVFSAAPAPVRKRAIAPARVNRTKAKTYRVPARFAGLTARNRPLRSTPSRPTPQPSFHTEIRRESFGSMIVEVTYRVYDFKPRKNSKTTKRALLA